MTDKQMKLTSAERDKQREEAAMLAKLRERQYAEQYAVEPAVGDVVGCPTGKHGDTTIVEFGSFTGYAGGKCYVTELACGCTDLDESADVRAAY